MDKKIILQKLNRNYIYFLLYIITIVIEFCFWFITSDILPRDKLKEITYHHAANQILNTYISLISYFIAIIPLLIKKNVLINLKKIRKLTIQI